MRRRTRSRPSWAAATAAGWNHHFQSGMTRTMATMMIQASTAPTLGKRGAGPWSRALGPVVIAVDEPDPGKGLGGNALGSGSGMPEDMGHLLRPWSVVRGPS